MRQPRTLIGLAGAVAVAALQSAFPSRAVPVGRGLGDVMPQMARDRRQTAELKAKGRKVQTAAYKELMAAQHAQVVLGHIHPRWVRREVERRLDLGQEVTQADIEAIRRG